MKFTEFTVGQTYTETYEDVRIEDIRVVSAITQDNNPIHYDPETAQELGHPGRVNQGSVNMSYVTQTVLSAVEPPGYLKRIQVRFENSVYEGETVTATSTVEEIRTDGDGIVEFSVELKKCDGTRAIRGTATVCYPVE